MGLDQRKCNLLTFTVKRRLMSPEIKDYGRQKMLHLFGAATVPGGKIRSADRVDGNMYHIFDQQKYSVQTQCYQCISRKHGSHCADRIYRRI